MARPLRILVAGGWYHVLNRGHRRSELFLTDTDRQRFLGLVSELPERFGVEVHAFVLMDNHYHLLLRTPEPNLHHAIRWLQVSYAVRFNWAHRQCGSVFAGRFKAVVIQDTKGVAEVARYVHLNPVRVEGLGLGKDDQRRARVVGCADPGAELVHQRLERLRAYRWNSWRVYGGKEPAPSWLTTGVLGGACGGRTRMERGSALVAYTEGPVRQGRLDSPWAGLVGGLVLGEADYARRMLQGRVVNREEQKEARQMRWRVEWSEVVRATEKVCGRRWAELLEAHGDWGRDGALYYAVRHGSQRLAEVVAQVSGLKYQAAAQAIKRFSLALEKDAVRRRFVVEMKRRLSNVQTRPHCLFLAASRCQRPLWHPPTCKCQNRDRMRLAKLQGRVVNREEQKEARQMRWRVEWSEVVRATEKSCGRRWQELLEAHGDWGRDGALYYAVRHGGQRLAEVVAQVSGLKYQAAAQAIKRFSLALEKDAVRRRFVVEMKRRLSNVDSAEQPPPASFWA